tara:strand:+ start:4362 stop:5564 length:1203 start_codon:yes stop_codon:yes gene_type:complete
LISWNIDKKRKEIIDSTAKRKVLVAGRRFGKSHLSLIWLLTKPIQSDERRWVITPTYRQGKTTTWKLMRSIFRNQDCQINESELLIKLPNNSEIAIKGAEQENNLRGAGLDMVVLEEYSYIKPHVWDEIIYPMLTTTDGEALFIGTPNGYDHLYDVYMLGQGGNPDWESWHYTTVDGGYVSKEEIEKAKSMMDERAFKTEFLGSFETTGNRAAYNFDRSVHIKKAQQITDRLAWGLDFNVDYMSAVLIVEYSDGSIHYLDEIRLTNSNTNEMALAMKKIAPNIPVYPDSAGSARSTSSNRSDHQILRDHGYNVISKKANPPVIDRLNALNRMLKDTNGKIRMTVDPRCRFLIKDLEQVQRTRDGKIDKSDIKLTHMLDASSYYIAYKHPIVNRQPLSMEW